MFALGYQTAGLVLILVGLLPKVSQADTLQGQPIYAQNNTNRTIWVAARYMPPGGGSYVSDGFWRVEPGQRLLILYNGNRRFMYLYARDGQGAVWSGNAVRTTVRGETLNMFAGDTGLGYEPWTMNFNP
jgi:uncharacterized membrane protein